MANITISTSGAIVVKQGTTLKWGYSLTDGVTPLDISGYECAMQVRKTIDSVTTIIKASTSLGGIVKNITDQRFDITLDPVATSAIRFSGDTLDAVYDVEVTAPDGFVTRIAEGPFTITREVTRD